MTQAWMDVSVDVFADALGLPHSCRVLDAAFGNNGVIAILVEDPTIHPDAMRVSGLWGKARDGSLRFQEWRAIAKRDPEMPRCARCGEPYGEHISGGDACPGGRTTIYAREPLHATRAP